MKNLRTKVLSAVLAVSVLGASAVAFTGCGNKDTTNDSKVTLTNVSYDPTRELYESYNKNLCIGKTCKLYCRTPYPHSSGCCSL